jgi:hypothetical protein
MNGDILFNIFSYLLQNVPFGKQYDILKSVSKYWNYVILNYPIKTTIIEKISLEKIKNIQSNKNIIYIGPSNGTENALIYKNYDILIKNLTMEIIPLIENSQLNCIKTTKCKHNLLVLYDYDFELFQELEILRNYIVRDTFKTISTLFKNYNLILCNDCIDLTIPSDKMLYEQTPNIIYNY